MLTITVTVDDTLAERLQADAAARGQDVNHYALTVLRAGVDALALPENGETAPRLHNAMEFAGVGAGRPGSLQGKDAQEYVNELRAEWEEREQSWRR